MNEWFDSIDDIAPRRRSQEAKRAAERAQWDERPAKIAAVVTEFLRKAQELGVTPTGSPVYAEPTARAFWLTSMIGLDPGPPPCWVGGGVGRGGVHAQPPLDPGP